MGLTGLLNFFKSSAASKRITSTLPNEILISNASGCGTHAIWEFNRGEGIQDVGQYDLEIILRVPHFHGVKKFGIGSYQRILYYIDWNIEINGKKLVDHDHDIDSNSWDMFVKYGNYPMKIMDIIDVLDEDLRKEIREKQSKYKEEWDKNRKKWINYWDNVIGKGDPIYGAPMRQEEQKYSVLRLLRPLVLVDTRKNNERISFLQEGPEKLPPWQTQPSTR